MSEYTGNVSSSGTALTPVNDLAKEVAGLLGVETEAILPQLQEGGKSFHEMIEGLLNHGRLDRLRVLFSSS